MRQSMGFTDLKHEYGILCQRLLPRPEIPAPFGSTWCVIEPGGAATPHDHPDFETFVFVEGEGELTRNGEKTLVRAGDVIYIPPFTRHELKNLSSAENLVFLSLWWEEKSNGADARGNPH